MSSLGEKIKKHLGKWEDGLVTPSNERLKQIANLGDMTLEELKGENILSTFTNMDYM